MEEGNIGRERREERVTESDREKERKFDDSYINTLVRLTKRIGSMEYREREKNGKKDRE